MVSVNACTSKSSTIYLATLFGSLVWENVADVEALTQLADDLTRLLPSWPRFVWGWVPAFLGARFLRRLKYDSIPKAVPAPATVVVPVSGEPFFEDVQGSNLHQCPECKAIVSTRVGMFLHKTKVHGYKSPIIAHKATHAHGASLFLLQRSLRMTIIAAISSASLVRNRGARKQAMFLQDDQRRVRPRTEEKEKEKGSACSKRFLESLDLRLREIEGRNAAWLISEGGHKQSRRPWSRQQITTKAKMRKRGKPHPMGPRRVTLAGGLLNALPVISLAKADQQFNKPSSRGRTSFLPSEGHVGAAAQNVHHTDQLLRRSQRVVQSQEN